MRLRGCGCRGSHQTSEEKPPNETGTSCLLIGNSTRESERESGEEGTPEGAPRWPTNYVTAEWSLTRGVKEPFKQQ